ncbi:E3 ubiquitin-protein ligase At1g12760-like [Wolffia australiana]
MDTRSSSRAEGPSAEPLLGSDPETDRDRRFRVRTTLRGAAQFLRRASSRRVMREPSMLVRETAAEQLEERRSDWAYSKPVVVLDLLWNLAFVAVAAIVLIISRNESPSMPLRVWIVGYALQCILHMVCVCMEFKRRQDLGSSSSSSSNSEGGESNRGDSDRSTPREFEEGEFFDPDQAQDERTSLTKHLESANTMFSFIWWIIGFYWVSTGGQSLTHDASQLYWLCIVFLAFDVFFVVFCVALACIIGIAVCCCLPCIIAILYAVADQEGASDEDISKLPRYKFRRFGDADKLGGESSGPFGGMVAGSSSEGPMEHVLSEEDSECCICLSTYEDGAELRGLPCNHHFHTSCIDKWLYINATCPLCKYNIRKNAAGDEV